MSAAEIDQYLEQLPAGSRATLEALRAVIVEVVPDVERCISFRVPAFRDAGDVARGFAGFKNHLSY